MESYRARWLYYFVHNRSSLQETKHWGHSKEAEFKISKWIEPSYHSEISNVEKESRSQ
jgi:hypothetical protein